MKPELYTLFWYIQLTSLFVPTSHYKDEIKRINEEISTV